MSELKITIFGGTGFIGRSLKKYYSDKNCNVLAPTRQEVNLLDRNECTEYLDTNRPDIVIFAAVNVLSVEESVQSFFNVLSNYRKFGRMICFGSGAEYNPKVYTPLMIEHKFTSSYPENGYPLAKFLMAREIELGPCKNAVNLRLFGVYGEYEDHSRRFISNNICRVLSGLPLSMNQDMKFDYIYVYDLCKIIDEIINKNLLSERSYNLCSGKPVTLKHLAHLIARQMDYKDEIIIKKTGMNHEYSGNPKKFFAEFGMFDFTQHQNAICKMVEYFINQFENSDQMKIFE